MPANAGRTGPLTTEIVAAHASPSNWVLAPHGDRVAFTIDSGDVQALYVMPADGGWPARITPDVKRYGRPAWAPDGHRLVAVSGNTLYRMRDDGTDFTALYEHPAGIQEPVWSPDGATIAFRSRERGWDHVWSIGFDGGIARRLTTEAADYDSMQWSPGARFIACTSTQENLLERGIYSIDAVTGTQVNFTAGSGCLNVAPSWSPVGGSLAFFSERDGFFHLYLRSQTGTIRQLTSGPCEDGGMHARSPQHICWSPDGSEIAFLRNRDGKMDVMVVSAEGEAPRRISPGDGNWGIVGWLPDGQHLLATFDSPTQPPDLWRISACGGEAEQITRSSGGIRIRDLVQPERIQFAARDGRTVSGYLYLPQGSSKDSPAPALVVPHGGPNSQFSFTWRPVFQLLAREGYAVFGPDFRGSTGYGREMRQANFGEWGNADLWDVVDAAEHLRGLEPIDADRVGVYGGSYGGYLVLCALTRSPQTFRCGVDLYGDSEIAESYRHGDRVGRRDLQRQMGDPVEEAKAYRRGSPVYEAERIEAPLLILHGKDDKRVVPRMSERMIEALSIEGKYFEHVMYEGEAHGFRKPANVKDSIDRTLKFLERHLKGKSELS